MGSETELVFRDEKKGFIWFTAESNTKLSEIPEKYNIPDDYKFFSKVKENSGSRRGKEMSLFIYTKGKLI